MTFTTDKQLNVLRNIIPNRKYDHNLKINGEDPWVEGAKLAEKQSKEYF